MIPCKQEGITLKTYIEKEPVFSNSIQLTETTDPGNADYMNIATKQIFANTLVNQKEIREGDSKSKIITFDSMDSKKADKWTDVAMMESGEKHKSLIEKISIMFKNVRYLYKLLGTTDISKIEDGTVTGAIKKVNKALKPIDAENRVENMTSINQITSIGFWTISAIDSNYASSIGIDNNTGDFYAIVSDYNGNGTDHFNFGDLLLFSPRLQGYHYAVDVLNGNARARLVLTNGNILTTKEQINSNTNVNNIAGAVAMKEMFSEINSNLMNKVELVYANAEFSTSEIDFSPFPFGVYMVIAYRFMIVIWRWSRSLRFKIIEKEDSVELTNNDLILAFNQPINYICIVQFWHK